MKVWTLKVKTCTSSQAKGKVHSFQKNSQINKLHVGLNLNTS